MTLLDSQPEVQSKQRLVVWVAIIVLIFLIVGLWYNFRFYAEERAVKHFFDALVAGDTASAYMLWHANPSYTMQDFLSDWGPNGYYGPVKSYRIAAASAPRGAGSLFKTVVAVTIEISPYSPFPDRGDVQKSRRTKTVTIWVQSKDKSLSFPP